MKITLPTIVLLLTLVLACAASEAKPSASLEVVRLKNNPIIRPEMLPGNDGKNINGPSLIRVPAWLPNPLGKYYLYFAHHSGKYIRLAFADQLEGPWNLYEPGTLRLEDAPGCKGHIASPDVIVDDERKEIRLYFHGPAKAVKDQKTFLATSKDGLKFTAADEILGKSYMRLFQWDGWWYGMSRMGRLYRSKDGLTQFETGPNPFPDNDPGNDDENKPGPRHVAVHREGNRLWVYYSNIGDEPERILRCQIELSGDWKNWKTSPPEEVLRPETEWEGVNLPLAKSPSGAARGKENALRDPCIFVEQGRLYLLYSVAGESGIGIAECFSRKPNIVFILADDLGYGDIGCFGQKKIRTPNLDRMAAEGIRFTQHYAGNTVCAPSRCVLMSGLHPGHAFIRDNKQAKAAGFDFKQGQVPVPEGSLQLPLLLKKLGYVTGAFGKWGLGPVGSTGDPARQGVDQFFGFNDQAVAHNYYPVALWDNAHEVPLNNPKFAAHQKFPADADANNPASYERYRGKEYAPDLIADRALQFIRDHQREPFFLYFPTTVPHLALQVPEDSLAEYAGAFTETPYLGNSIAPIYLPHRTPRAAYAAMITRMDRDIGRLMKLVNELGLDEKTIFVFTSDNGPLYDKLGGTDADYFESAGSFRGRKGSLHEGGVRVPCIVRWKGRIASSGTSDRVTGFEDWLPTLLELIGEKSATPAKLDGISFAPTLLGKKQEPRPFLYRELPGYGGQQSVRVGAWKAIRKDLAPKKATAPSAIRTELYDLAADPNEATDVATKHPDILARLERLMRDQHTVSKEFPLVSLDKSTWEKN